MSCNFLIKQLKINGFWQKKTLFKQQLFSNTIHVHTNNCAQWVCIQVKTLLLNLAYQQNRLKH